MTVAGTELVTGLGALADRYDVLLCDVWGVIHNGEYAHPAAGEALARFRDAGGTVVLVSNAPRPHDDVIPQLERLGVRRDAWDRIVTSGDVARQLIAARPGQRARFQGPERDHTLFAGLDAPLAAPGQADYIICTGFDDDEVQTPADYAGELAVMARRGLEMICANPDLVVERGNRLIPCAGLMAQAYEALGGKTIYPGKPHAPIYAQALAMAGQLRNAPVAQARVMGVGDAIRTDIAGAQAQGVASLMVMRGIHSRELFDATGGLHHAALPGWFARQDAQPTYALADLVW
jgi:HAD superfamily hydrolase (TIGR01459 family)